LGKPTNVWGTWQGQIRVTYSKMFAGFIMLYLWLNTTLLLLLLLLLLTTFV